MWALKIAAARRARDRAGGVEPEPEHARLDQVSGQASSRRRGRRQTETESETESEANKETVGGAGPLEVYNRDIVDTANEGEALSTEELRAIC
jgi:hypothetical protein